MRYVSVMLQCTRAVLPLQIQSFTDNCHQNTERLKVTRHSCDKISTQQEPYIENASWKVRVYGFYSRVVKYNKTNERASFIIRNE